ncbi:amino acid ABC transporter permease [Bradyrhizobium japonicum]|uniref:amino acid ABC transporter permease n=1 Tax=Bradyrhizobium japonicum TaxID=375 RepID=UPI001364DBCB|nr:amino acid ABC transporter permease [Bradyrhizobium japonicum]
MTEVIEWLGVLSSGLLVTVELTVATMVLVAPLAALLAISAVSPWGPVRWASRIYTDVFRSIPLLALLLFAYYIIGPLGVTLGITAFHIAIVALTLNEAAYLSEVYRGAIESVPGSQLAAAASLGLGWRKSVWLVVLPQALPACLPGTMNMAIATIKGSALASIITVPEVTLEANELIAKTFKPLEIYLILAGLYIALTIPLMLVTQRVESRVRSAEGT